MTNTTAPVLERLTTEEAQALPNKFIYPEFAGFKGEKLMRRLLKAILPLALFRTWETFEEEHAYDNDCFLSLTTVARDLRRSQRTIDRNIATLIARGLLKVRSEHKFFRTEDGRTYKKPVVIKDFSGLYALAHEYYLWTFEDPDYLPPHAECLDLIKQDEYLVVKLDRFEDYHRLLMRQQESFAEIPPDPRFARYQDQQSSPRHENRAEDAERNQSGPKPTVLSPILTAKPTANLSKERINETAQNENLNGDSLESEKTFEEGRAGGCDYRKHDSVNEKRTKTIPSSPQNDIRPGAGNTRERDENHPDVQEARSAMEVAGVEPGRKQRSSRRRQTEEELPPPPKNSLARSFIDVISAPFGDTNIKGTKTGIERSIETFELRQSDTVLCLVRAMQVAKTSTIRKENINQTGVANRMKLYCHMFKEFARARASGSKWDYSWEQMLDDLEADDLFAEWIIAHQAELAEEGSGQAFFQEEETPEELALRLAEEVRATEGEGVAGDQRTGSRASVQPVEKEVEFLPTDNPGSGWPTQAGADNRGERLLNEVDPFRTTYTWVSKPTAHGRWGFEILKRRGRQVVERCLNNEDIVRAQEQLPRGGYTYQF